jgi:hypothetical protein
MSPPETAAEKARLLEIAHILEELISSVGGRTTRSYALLKSIDCHCWRCSCWVWEVSVRLPQ